MEEAKTSLQSWELKRRMDDSHGGTSSGEGLMIRGRTEEKKKNFQRRRSKSRNKNKNNNVCHNCQREGHWKRNCPELKRDKASTSEFGGAAVASEESDGGNVLFVSSNVNDDDWILDSGCTFHMTPNRDWFATFQAIEGGKVLMGDDGSCSIAGKGTMQIKMVNGIVRTLTDVRYVPKLRKNLISLSTLDSLGCTYRAEGGVLRVSRGSLTVMKGQLKNGLYILQGSTVVGTTAVSSNSNLDQTHLWHMRLGHMSERGMDELSKRGLLGRQRTGKLEFCEHCVYGKQRRVKFSTGVHRTRGTLDYIHSDLWGSSSVPSHGGARYILTFIDDYSRKVWIYVLKQKSEVFLKFKQWKSLVEKQTEKKVKRLRTDNGLEFCNNEFNEFCTNEGIVRHRTVRHTPQQNGVAERMNMTLLERARCMLSNADLPKQF